MLQRKLANLITTCGMFGKQGRHMRLSYDKLGLIFAKLGLSCAYLGLCCAKLGLSCQAGA